MLSDRQVSVILEDGTRIDLDAEAGEGEKAVHASMTNTWDFFSRDACIYVSNAQCQIGDWVTVELRFPLETITLSAQISDREV